MHENVYPSLTRSRPRSSVLAAKRETPQVLTGTKKDKAELEKSDPTLYKYFIEVWKIRNNHMGKTLPTNYVFLLRCCGMSECPHPLCQGMYIGSTEIDMMVIMVFFIDIISCLVPLIAVIGLSYLSEILLYTV